MNGGTHAALGFAAGVAALSMQETTEIYEGFLVLSAIFASLMPDLDEENSMIYGYTMEKISPEKRRKLIGGLGALCILVAVFIFSGPLFMAGIYCMAIPFSGHRKFTHSLLALAIVSYLADSIHPDFMLPVLLGYLSHLLADSLTVSGVPWLWPITKTFRITKLKTGGVFDHLLGIVTLYYALIMWYRM